MSIKVQCGCGKVCSAPDHLAGKTAKCPSCGGQVVVPSEGTNSSPGRQCLTCAAPLPADALVCTTCGLDLRTGQQAGASAAEEDSGGNQGDGEAAERAMRRTRARWVLLPTATWLGSLLGILFIMLFVPGTGGVYKALVNISATWFVLGFPVALILTCWLGRLLLGMDAAWWPFLPLMPLWYPYHLFGALKIWAETYIWPDRIGAGRMIAAAFSGFFGAGTALGCFQVVLDRWHDLNRLPFGLMIVAGCFAMAGMFLLCFKKDTLALGSYGGVILLGVISGSTGAIYAPVLSLLFALPAVVSLVKKAKAKRSG